MNELLVPKFNREKAFDNSLKRVFEKISYIIDKNFKAKIVFRTFSSIGTPEEDTLKKLLFNNSPLKLSEKILFPVTMDSKTSPSTFNHIKGFIQLSPAGHLDPIQLNRIKDILDLLLIQNITNLERIKSLSHATTAKKAETSSNDNVLYLNSFRETTTIEQIFLDNSEKNLSESIFIYSNRPSEIHKMAFEMHLNSKRFAFLQLNDIDLSDLNFEGFKSLTDINIFIPNIVNVDLRRQALLKTILLKGPQFEFPKIITGSTRDAAYLSKFNLVDPELLNLLSTLNLYMNKSFDDYKKAGLIDELL